MCQLGERNSIFWAIYYNGIWFTVTYLCFMQFFFIFLTYMQYEFLLVYKDIPLVQFSLMMVVQHFIHSLQFNYDKQ